MGFFDHLNKNGASAVKSKIVKQTVFVTTKVAPKLVDRKATAPAPAAKRSTPKPYLGSASTRKSESRDGTPSRSGGSKKRVHKEERLLSSPEGSDDEDYGRSPRPTKRHRSSSEAPLEDLERVVPWKQKKLDIDDSIFVHATEITPAKRGYKAAFGAEEPIIVQVQYPSDTTPERYELVRPKDTDDFYPMEDIVRNIELIAGFHVPANNAEPFLDPETGVIRLMRKAAALNTPESGVDFRKAVKTYNTLIRRMREDKTIEEHLGKSHSIPFAMTERILSQAYARTVAPKVGDLRKYESWSNEVYGELLPTFAAQLFKETGLSSKDVFVDLGSGVGNVVLQAALQIGCESYGCEIRDDVSALAELQWKEFEARCKLWGIASGQIQIEKGDFLVNPVIGKALKKADVVLVNNYAFSPQLNDELVNLFLDLPEGCRVVSLKPFVPPDHKITSRNLNSPVNLLRVQKREYFSRSVSWTDAPGIYYVATKDSTALRRFMARQSR